MELKELKTLEDFEGLEQGDNILCEFHRNIHDYPKKPFRINTFKIYDNKKRTNEIILQRKNNIYFNYEMFLSKDMNSNLKSAFLIK